MQTRFRAFLAAGWLLLTLIDPGGARAAQRAPATLPEMEAMPEFIFRNWRTEEGLPENSVTGLAQTSNGYIWCTTFNGLARFDGVRFEIFDSARNPEFPTSRMIALGAGKGNSLVIQTEFGDLVLWQNGRFIRPPFGRGFTISEVIIEDEKGAFWRSTLESAVPAWKPLSEGASGAPVGELRVVIPIHSCYAEKNGSFIRLTAGRLSRLAPGEGWVALELADAREARFSMIAPGRKGLWLQSEGALRLLEGNEVTRALEIPKELAYTTVAEDAQGTIWLPSWNGELVRLNPRDGAAARLRSIPGTGQAAIRSLIVDREGSVWIGLHSFGLMQIRPKPLRTFGVADGLLGEVIRSVNEDSEGNLWIVSTSGLNLFQAGRFESPPHLQLGSAWSSTPAGPGRMWLSTYGRGLYLVENGNPRPVGGEMHNKWWDPDFTFLFADSAKTLWFGNSLGLFRFDGTNAQAVPLPVEPQPDVRMAIEGIDRRMYAASNGRGLFVSDPERKKWKRLGRESGLEDEQIYSLHRGPDGLVWIGTAGAGLARYDGTRIVSFRGAVPDLPRSVTGIESDDQGYLWLASTHGIYRVSIADLNAAARGGGRDPHVFEYQRGAGLKSSECTAGIQPSVVKSRDGRIWFATSGGLVCFDPSNLQANPLPPPVAIEAATAGGDRLDLTRAVVEQGRVRLREGTPRTIFIQPGADPLVLEFTGLSFISAENVRFRHRMEGVDPDWNAGRARRATYQRLPPGRFLFRVRASNSDGIWNETEALLAVVRLPHYWETAWFKIGLAAAAALVLFGLHRYRLAQAEALTRMRARIAADLHDELGSNMGAVVLHADLLKTSHALSESEREQISDIHRMAQNTAQAIREIGWFINPDFDSLEEMIVRMREVAERMLADRAMEFSADGAIPARRLSLGFRRNVMAIYKEALNNVVRHSRARKVAIRISVAASFFNLEIRDDGQGFDPARAGSGQGLRNLRQRATELRGLLRVQTAPESGTLLSLRAELK